MTSLCYFSHFILFFFFFSSRRRHTRFDCDWSSDVCSSDLMIRHTRFDCDWSSDVCSSDRSEEHTSELQSQSNLVCRLLLEDKTCALPIDRKSTRLNSSHSQISYAVLLERKSTRLNSSHSQIPDTSFWHARRRGSGASGRPSQGWITTGMSVWRRISSAWDTTTALGRPCWWLRWAPANSASHWVRLITWATTSPGLPGSTWVTKGTRCIDSMASATPTTWRPASRSSAAWLTCTVLPTTVAKLAASSSARRLVSRPSRSEERRVGKECRSRWSPDH